ncbi:MAG: hypothetical protein ACRD98_00530 [Nitrososphaera sp.]
MVIEFNSIAIIMNSYAVRLKKRNYFRSSFTEFIAAPKPEQLDFIEVIAAFKTVSRQVSRDSRK